MLYIPSSPLPENAGHSTVPEWSLSDEMQTLEGSFEMTHGALEQVVPDNDNSEMAREHNEDDDAYHYNRSAMDMDDSPLHKNAPQENSKPYTLREEEATEVRSNYITPSDNSSLPPTPFTLSAPTIDPPDATQDDYRHYYSQQFAMDSTFELATRTFYATMQKFSRQNGSEYRRRTAYSFLENWHLHSMYSKSQQVLLGMPNAQPVVFLSGDDLMFTPPLVQQEPLMDQFEQMHFDWEEEEEEGFENYRYDLEHDHEHHDGDHDHDHGHEPGTLIMGDDGVMMMAAPTPGNGYRNEDEDDDDDVDDYGHEPYEQCTHGCCQYQTMPTDYTYTTDSHPPIIMDENTWMRQYHQQQEMHAYQSPPLPERFNADLASFSMDMPTNHGYSQAPQVTDTMDDQRAPSSGLTMMSTEWIDWYRSGSRGPSLTLGATEEKESYLAQPQTLKPIPAALELSAVDSITITLGEPYTEQEQDSQQGAHSDQDDIAMTDQIPSNEVSKTEHGANDEPTDTFDGHSSYQSLVDIMAQPSSSNAISETSKVGYGTTLATRDVTKRTTHIHTNTPSFWFSDIVVPMIVYILAVADAFVGDADDDDLERQECGEMHQRKATGRFARFFRSVMAIWQVFVLCAESMLHVAFYPKSVSTAVWFERTHHLSATE